ncbi:MAG: polysaccharide deacetylase [Deltaproteobacteria bacterium]|nr:polysaccharide deacetylase [Deltaproteobacteria bacterium]
MNRFLTVTILFALTALGIGLSLQGVERIFLLGGLAAAYLTIFGLGVSILKFNFFLKAVCRGDSSIKWVTLTFDDGPDPVCTPALLKTLKCLDIKAAFFPIGLKTRQYPEVLKMIDQEGHVLGNHSFRHTWWTNLLISGGLDREIQRTQEAIGAAIGKAPAFFRPPMGLTNPHLGGRLKKHGLTLIGWDVRPFDTRRGDDRVIEDVLKKVRNGSIILLHEAGRGAPELAALISGLVTGLKTQGYSIVGLEELVGIKAYQPTEEGNPDESVLAVEKELEAGEFRKQGGFRMFLAKKLIATAYIKKAMKERVTLDAFKSRPSPRFLWGVSFVLGSYILGWPMVGLFSFLAAYFQTPALLIVGPAFYGFSHFVFLFGMYLAGRDCIRYADIMLSWALRRAMERALPRRIL